MPALFQVLLDTAEIVIEEAFGADAPVAQLEEDEVLFRAIDQSLHVREPLEDEGFELLLGVDNLVGNVGES